MARLYLRTDDARIARRDVHGTWTWLGGGAPPDAAAAATFVPLDAFDGDVAAARAHNARVDAWNARDYMAPDPDVVAVKFSHLVFLRDLQAAVAPLPWLVRPSRASLWTRCHRVQCRHRALRRAYNAYTVANARRAYDVDLDNGMFPPVETVSWTVLRRRVQAQRRARGRPAATVRTFRGSADLRARHYRPHGGGAVPVGAFPWRPGPSALPGNDTLAQYYEHGVLQRVERGNVASHLGSLVHQRLLLRWAASGADRDGDQGTNPDADARARLRYNRNPRRHGRRGLVRVVATDGGGPARVQLHHGAERPMDAADFVPLDGTRYRQYGASAFQPVFPVPGADGLDVPRTVLLPTLVKRHVHAASQEYRTEAPGSRLLVDAMVDAVAAAVDAEHLDPVAVEPWVYDPHRLFYTDEGGDGLFDAHFFWTRADFVARCRDTGKVLVGELKNKFGATTQTAVLDDAAAVQQAVINAFLFSLAYRVRVDEVCWVYANRARHVVIARHPFAAAAALPFVRSTLEAYLELTSLYVDRHGVVSEFQQITTPAARRQFVPWKFLASNLTAVPDGPPTEPLAVAGPLVPALWYCKQHGWVPVQTAFRGEGRLVLNFQDAPPPWDPPPLFRIGAAAFAPFTWHGGVNPFRPCPTRRVYPRDEPASQRSVRSAYLVRDVAAAAGRLAHLLRCTQSPLDLARTVLGRACGDHDVGTRPDACDRCGRWRRRYPATGAAACPGGRSPGPCAHAHAHAPHWKARRAPLIRALHRRLNQHVAATHRLDAAGGPSFARFVSLSQRPFWSERCKRAARAHLSTAVGLVLAVLERDATVAFRGGRGARQDGDGRAATVRWVMMMRGSGGDVHTHHH